MRNAARRQHGGAVGRVPARAHPGQLGGELGAVGVAVGEEELELEQVAQGRRGVPAVLGLGEQHQLGDRAVDEVVDRGVAVERRHEVLAAFDRVHRLLAARVDRDDPRALQRAEHPPQPGVGGQRSDRADQPPLLQVAAHRAEHLPHLRERQRAVAHPQQGQGDQRGGHDRGDPVDPHADLERHLLQRQPPVGLGGERVAQRDRLGEPDVGRSERLELGAGVAGEPRHPLALLRRPDLLGGHRRHLAQLVVGDRHRHEVDVVDAALLDRLGHVGQQAVARRAQLAGARAAALHVPLHVEPLGQQVAEVLADGELVDLVVAEAAPDEHHARPAWPAARPARSSGCPRRARGCAGSRARRARRRAAADRRSCGGWAGTPAGGCGCAPAAGPTRPRRPARSTPCCGRAAARR